MYEKLDQAKVISLEEMIPEPYKVTIGQVIKNCKLNKEKFELEINFTLNQLNEMQAILKEQQRRILDPSIAMAEKGIHIFDEQRMELLHEKELLEPLIKKQKK